MCNPCLDPWTFLLYSGGAACLYVTLSLCVYLSWECLRHGTASRANVTVKEENPRLSSPPSGPVLGWCKEWTACQVWWHQSADGPAVVQSVSCCSWFFSELRLELKFPLDLSIWSRGAVSLLSSLSLKQNSEALPRASTCANMIERIFTCRCTCMSTLDTRFNATGRTCSTGHPRWWWRWRRWSHKKIPNPKETCWMRAAEI